MRRRQPAFHLWVRIHSSDCSGRNRGSQAHAQVNNRQFRTGTLPGETPIFTICYDVGVWKHLTARNGREFVRHVVPAVLKPARTLWNEIIGFVFMCLAVYCGSGVVRSYMKLVSAPPDQVADHL